MKKTANTYSQLIEAIFFDYYKKGITEIPFEREELVAKANHLEIKLPKNLGDVLYSFRYRYALPKKIVDTAPASKEWVIKNTGRSQYKFVLIKEIAIVPSSILSETKVLNATPGIIARYAMSDEQALLAKIRYNRLVDIFTGYTCYSLQNHFRTTVSSIGQIETDEVYVGIDKRGVHYVIPVQAKGGNDKLGVVQIEQDFEMAKEKFATLICKPIAAQFMKDGKIALFEFEMQGGEITVASEKHYRLVEPHELSDDELDQYKTRL
ncbi:hypothetical protein [Flavitalea sp.]|nr:hypothetical protein [Flavitalea sp.]